MSARDLSLSLGISVGYINKIENRKTIPSLNILTKIYLYFGIDLKDFLNIIL